MRKRGPSFKPDATDPNSIGVWYAALNVGRFSGNPPLLQWMGPDLWLHHEDKHFPFSFTRADGSVLMPGSFDTDGGSIPALLQVFPRMSAWYFGAAYLLHDWIWHLHKMGVDTYSFEESNLILCEAIKTLQVKGFVNHRTFKGGATTAYNIWRGVNSHWARKKWEDYGNSAQLGS